MSARIPDVLARVAPARYPALLKMVQGGRGGAGIERQKELRLRVRGLDQVGDSALAGGRQLARGRIMVGMRTPPLVDRARARGAAPPRRAGRRRGRGRRRRRGAGDAEASRRR